MTAVCRFRVREVAVIVPPMDRAADTLVVVAHELELGGLRAALQADEGGCLRGEIGGRRVRAEAVGVGLAAAAVGTVSALTAARPAHLLLLGSYGRYPGRGAPQSDGVELLVPTVVRALDPGVAAGEAAFPEPMPVERATDESLSEPLAAASGALRAALGVTAAITTDDGLAFRLAAGECHGENLEALGVALACERVAVPFTALLGCTNEVGSRGREQWRRNHAAAAEATSAAALAWLETG